MSYELGADRVIGWIDQDLVEDITPMQDEAAEFNVAVQMSGILLHVIRRRPDGPILIGQTIEFSEEIRDRIRALAPAARSELVARVREALMNAPVIYGFQDGNGANVAFEDMQRTFLESRIYPDEASQGRLMRTLVDVWKAMRFLDDLPTLIDAVDARGG